MDNFVPLASLRSAAEMKSDPFLKDWVARHTAADGSDADPGVYRRVQNEHCQKCHAEYKKKFPDQAFKINCRGIHDEVDFAEAAAQTGQTMLEAAEFYDVETWAENYIVIADAEGNFRPYSAEDRPFQRPVLKCTAQFQVDRMGRGMGKTLCGVATELHKAISNKNYPILVLCPAKAQAQMWYAEIKKQIDHSPMLRHVLRRSGQAPFYEFEFTNGSTIRIFTAGSKAGRGADAIRGQSPRRVRLDEQDFLVEADYDAVTALLSRFPDSEFHGSSTPTGARSMYWTMCTQMPTYREFWVPVTEKKGWDAAQEAELRRQAKTADRYNHEYLALFGDLEQGVFKGLTVDAAKKQYTYAQALYAPDGMGLLEMVWNDCPRQSRRHYVLGCDWNGHGTGTRIRVVEYDPDTKIRRCVYTETIDSDSATTTLSLTHIKLLNRAFDCDHLYCDKGFGFAQDELLRQMGVSTYPGFLRGDERLLQVNFVGSKENLKTNRLVPKRDPNSPYVDDKELERQTKPFMVEGCVMALEQLKVQISSKDERLEAQMRDFRVKTYSANGQAASYEAKTEGDHDLDAWILAMLGVELNYGLFFDAAAHVRLAQLTHVTSFGGAGVEAKIEAARKRFAGTGVPSRTVPQDGAREDWNVLVSGRNSAMVAPSRSSAAPAGGRTGAAGNRTAIFGAGSTARSQLFGPPARGGSSRNYPLGGVRGRF